MWDETEQSSARIHVAILVDQVNSMDIDLEIQEEKKFGEKNKSLALKKDV